MDHTSLIFRYKLSKTMIFGGYNIQLDCLFREMDLKLRKNEEKLKEV